MSSHPTRGARRAFTLVELLVVVGIIAVLVALLLPALRAAARRADAVACLSNLRQIGHTHTLYRADHKGATPLYRGDGYWADAYATRPWSYPRPLSGGYGFNGFVHTADLFGLVVTQDITFNDWFVRRDTKEAPRVPLAGDCTWSIAWPTARDRTPPDLHAGDRGQQGYARAPRGSALVRC
jgi:prepilin-type N-terminal cleavage/methylation domain-containing protein